MDISETIKNRIIKLTLYTNMSAKGIINAVSDEVPITIEEYCNILDEYEKIPNIATAKHIPAIISIRSS